MTLATDISNLRNDRLRKLNGLHDDYDHTRKLRRMQQVGVERYGQSQTFHNRITGTRVTGQELASRTGASLWRLNEQTFKEILAQFELFATDLLRLWLSSHVHLVDEKAIDIRTLFGSNSLDDIRKQALEEAVESATLKKAYSSPVKWFRYLHEIIGVEIIKLQDITTFAEFKATRDVLEHSDGIANALYRVKAGTMARYRPGEAVIVDDEYSYEGISIGSSSY